MTFLPPDFLPTEEIDEQRSWAPVILFIVALGDSMVIGGYHNKYTNKQTNILFIVTDMRKCLQKI